MNDCSASAQNYDGTTLSDICNEISALPVTGSDLFLVGLLALLGFLFIYAGLKLRKRSRA